MTQADPRSQSTDSIIKHAFQAPKLINVERAYETMDKYNLSGIVASVPHNIYYISSHSGIMQWMGRHFSTFAFFPRDENAEAALIVNGSMLYHFDYRPTWIENIKAVSGPQHDEAGQVITRSDGDPLAVKKIGIWPTREGAEMKRGDIIQRQFFDRYEDKTVPSALHGLKDALIEGNASNGRVGFDDPRVGHWLADIGLSDMATVDACNIFKEIRLAKTENELILLRGAAERNERALDYAISQIEPGQDLVDIEYNHARKWAELGGSAKWLIANVNGVNSGKAEVGDWMKLDSVGSYRGYTGDVGRTVVLGDPPDELARRIEANTKVSKQLYQYIRPGMLFMDIFKMFGEMMKDEGIDFAVAGPHDVGLEHTDHPLDLSPAKVPGSLPYTELRFLENTVFTLDMPHNEIGWGTTHVEDMMVVKNDGCKLLSSGDTSLRIVKG